MEKCFFCSGIWMCLLYTLLQAGIRPHKNNTVSSYFVLEVWLRCCRGRTLAELILVRAAVITVCSCVDMSVDIGQLSSGIDVGWADWLTHSFSYANAFVCVLFRGCYFYSLLAWI